MKYNQAFIQYLMQNFIAAAADAGTPFIFPFSPGDVADVFISHQTLGNGTWFHLHDGRIFAPNGKPAPDSSVTLYT